MEAPAASLDRTPLTRTQRWQVAAWAAAMLLLLLLRLGAAPLFDVDEGAFSEATREMLASGDYGHTTLNGAPRFDKPILVYWLQAASVSAFGLNEFALRLPSALCAWAWCLAVAAFARPRFGLATALLAGTVLATSVGVLAIGRAATADSLLNLLLALAGLDLWRYLETGQRTPLRRGFAWIGLGLLAKGPVALIVPGAAALLWVLTSRAWRPLWRAVTDLPAWALMLAIAVPWYAYALNRHGMAFVDGFLLRHNVERYTGTLQGHGGSLFYYVLVLPLLWLPWSPLLWPVLRHAPRLWREPLPRFLLGWAGFVVVFFSLSGTKLPHYVLYGATPLALLMAQQLVKASAAMRAALAAGLALLLLVFGGLAWLLPQFADRIRDPFYRTLIETAPPGTALACASLAVAIVLVLAVRAGPSSPAPFALRHAVAAWLTAAVVVGVAVPWWSETLQGPVRQLAAHATGSEPVVQWKTNLPSFSVYRQQPTPLRDPQPGELALVRLDRLPKDVPVEQLHEDRGLALVRRR